MDKLDNEKTSDELYEEKNGYRLELYYSGIYDLGGVGKLDNVHWGRARGEDPNDAG